MYAPMIHTLSVVSLIPCLPRWLRSTPATPSSRALWSTPLRLRLVLFGRLRPRLRLALSGRLRLRLRLALSGRLRLRLRLARLEAERDRFRPVVVGADR